MCRIAFVYIDKTSSKINNKKWVAGNHLQSINEHIRKVEAKSTHKIGKRPVTSCKIQFMLKCMLLFHTACAYSYAIQPNTQSTNTRGLDAVV